MTEVLNKVRTLNIDKSDWTPVRFGDVVDEPRETIKDFDGNEVEYVIGLEHIESEDIHIRNFDTTEESTSFTRLFRKGDVLFGRRRAYLKKAALAPFTGICSGDIIVMRAKEQLMPELLPFIVNNDKFFDYAVKHSAGGLSPRVKFKDLAEYEFKLPSKDQQAQLAELLWAMDGVIESRKELLQRTKISRESYFEEYHHTYKGKETELKFLLENKNDKSQSPHVNEKYIGLEHIESGAFRCIEFSPSSEANAQCNIIQKGDLCYSKLRPYLDKAFIADFDAVSSTEILVFDTKKVSKEYVLHHLHSPSFLKYISKKGYGTKMPRVNMKLLGAYNIKVLEHEENLLNKMNNFLKNENNIKNSIRRSQSLLNGIINQIFSHGRVLQA